MSDSLVAGAKPSVRAAERLMSKEQAHDTLFKETFSSPENAASHLRAVLPAAIVERIDWSSLASLPTDFIVQQLDSVQSDVLLSAKLDGRDTLIYVLFEHQSSETPLMAFRMLRYVVCIWSDYLKQHPTAKMLPAVIPCVLYHGRAPWKSATDCFDLIDLDDASRLALRSLLPSISFQLDDLRALSEREILERAVPAAVRLVLLALRNFATARDPNAELERLGALLAEVAAADSGPTVLATILWYLLGVAEPDTERLQRFLDRQLGPKGTEAFVTAAEKIAEKSRAEGRTEGRAEVLLKQLALRFGSLPAGVEERVRRASANELDRLAERVLTAQSLDEVLGE